MKNKFTAKMCNNKMSFEECEYAILRHAIDETERQQLTSMERGNSKSNRSSNTSIDMSGHLTISDNKVKDISMF